MRLEARKKRRGGRGRIEIREEGEEKKTNLKTLSKVANVITEVQVLNTVVEEGVHTFKGSFSDGKTRERKKEKVD